MFFSLNHIMFLFTMMFGTMMSISANSWFTSWMGLEINLLSVIPLILNKLSYSSTEACIKYFLPQAMASLILIFWTSINLQSTEMYFMSLSEYFITAALLTKAGAAPLHFWFPQVIENCSWPQCLIFFTWQKIAPILLMSYFMSEMLMFLSILSALTGMLGGLNQNNMKIILTYSSISHLGWMIMPVVFSSQTWFIYFTIYSIISFTAIWLFLFSGVSEKINEMKFWPVKSGHKYIFILNMLSLGGLPPLLGFTAKLSVIILIMKSNILTLLLILILSSLVSLYFYCRVFYSATMMASSVMNKMTNNQTTMMNAWMTMSIFINILIPFVIIAF